jgi:hypothetical protein
MDGPDGFDDLSLGGIFAGAGDAVDPGLADLFADMRTAYTSMPLVVGAELGVLVAPGPTTTAAVPRTFSSRPRFPLLAKIAAATAAVVAATGGLAVAGALPASLQRAISHIGIGAPPTPSRPHGPHDRSPAARNGATLTPTTTRNEPPRSDASERDGTAVPRSSATGGHACDQRPTCSNTPTTIANATTPTTSPGDNNGQTNQSGDNTPGGDNGDQNNTPTTATGTGDSNNQRSDTTIGDQQNNRTRGENSADNNSGSGN